MKYPLRTSLLDLRHEDFELLDRISVEIVKRAGTIVALQDSLALMLRKAIDDIIDTPRTQRHKYLDLEKTEKTYLGTRVEILIRHHLKLARGKLDLKIAGADVDVKFTGKHNWMIPKKHGTSHAF